jgi:DNA-directed RNA polymerase subunit RPC12/RpoP
MDHALPMHRREGDMSTPRVCQICEGGPCSPFLIRGYHRSSGQQTWMDRCPCAVKILVKVVPSQPPVLRGPEVPHFIEPAIQQRRRCQKDMVIWFLSNAATHVCISMSVCMVSEHRRIRIRLFKPRFQSHEPLSLPFRVSYSAPNQGKLRGWVHPVGWHNMHATPMPRCPLLAEGYDDVL